MLSSFARLILSKDNGGGTKKTKTKKYTGLSEQEIKDARQRGKDARKLRLYGFTSFDNDTPKRSKSATKVIDSVNDFSVGKRKDYSPRDLMHGTAYFRRTRPYDVRNIKNNLNRKRQPRPPNRPPPPKKNDSSNIESKTNDSSNIESTDKKNKSHEFVNIRPMVASNKNRKQNSVDSIQMNINRRINPPPSPTSSDGRISKKKMQSIRSHQPPSPKMFNLNKLLKTSSEEIFNSTKKLPTLEPMNETNKTKDGNWNNSKDGNWNNSGNWNNRITKDEKIRVDEKGRKINRYGGRDTMTKLYAQKWSNKIEATEKIEDKNMKQLQILEHIAVDNARNAEVVAQKDVVSAVTEGFCHAAMKGNVGEIELYLRNENASVSRKNKDGAHPLLCAITADEKIPREKRLFLQHQLLARHYNKIVLLLLAAGAPPNLPNSKNGDTCLAAAARADCVEIIKMLIEAGANRKQSGKRGSTPCAEAARFGNIKSVKALLKDLPHAEQKVVASQPAWSSDGATPLHTAAAGGHVEVMKMLIKYGAYIEARRTSDGMTPLHLACQKKSIKAVCVLLNAEAHVYATDNAGATPIWQACRVGAMNITKRLLEAGSDPNTRTLTGSTAFLISCTYGFANICKLLSDNDHSIANTSCIDNNGTNALIASCMSGNSKTVQFVIQQLGIDCGHKDNRGQTCIDAAIRSGNPAVISLLVQAGTSIEEIAMPSGHRPLHAATHEGNVRIVEILLDSDVDAGSWDSRGESALTIAASNSSNNAGKSITLVKLLLGTNAFDINTVNPTCKGARSPLFAACCLPKQKRLGNRPIIQILLRSGAMIEQEISPNGITPLIGASQVGNLPAVKLLIESGADVNHTQKDGVGPLFTACVEGLFEVAVYLLSVGAFVNLCDIDGISPLMAASKNNYTKITSLLINAGGDRMLRNKYNKSAFEMIQTNNEKINQKKKQQRRNKFDFKSATTIKPDKNTHGVESILVLNKELQDAQFSLRKLHRHGELSTLELSIMLQRLKDFSDKCETNFASIGRKLLNDIDDSNRIHRENSTIPGKCANCGMDEVIGKGPGKKKHIQCRKCSVTLYCCNKCQKNHWPTHKTACRILRKFKQKTLNIGVSANLTLDLSNVEACASYTTAGRGAYKNL